MSLRPNQLLPLAAAFAFGTFAFNGIAQASTPKDLPSVVVRYDDLTLNTRAGVANLHSRLRTAAQTEESAAPGDPKWLRFHSMAERSFWKAYSTLDKMRRQAARHGAAPLVGASECPGKAQVESPSRRAIAQVGLILLV